MRAVPVSPLRTRQAEKAANSNAEMLATGASNSYAMVDLPVPCQTLESGWIYAMVGLDSSSLAMLKAYPTGLSPHSYARMGANQGFSDPKRDRMEAPAQPLKATVRLLPQCDKSIIHSTISQFSPRYRPPALWAVAPMMREVIIVSV
jgi:hypothetical protein